MIDTDSIIFDAVFKMSPYRSYLNLKDNDAKKVNNNITLVFSF